MRMQLRLSDEGDTGFATFSGVLLQEGVSSMLDTPAHKFFHLTILIGDRDITSGHGRHVLGSWEDSFHPFSRDTTK